MFSTSSTLDHLHENDLPPSVRLTMSEEQCARQRDAQTAAQHLLRALKIQGVWLLNKNSASRGTSDRAAAYFLEIFTEPVNLDKPTVVKFQFFARLYTGCALPREMLFII